MRGDDRAWTVFSLLLVLRMNESDLSERHLGAVQVLDLERQGFLDSNLL